MAFIGNKSFFSDDLAFLQGANSSLSGGYDKTTAIDFSTKTTISNSVYSSSGYDRIKIANNTILVRSGEYELTAYDLNGNQLFIITITGSPNLISSFDMGSNRIVVGNVNGDNTRGEVYVYDLKGTLLFTIKVSSNANISGNNYGDIVLVGCGRILSQSTNAHTTLIYDMYGNLIKKFEYSSGSAEPYFRHIGSNRIIAQGDSSGSFYIYDLNGNLIKTVNSPITLTSIIFTTPGFFPMAVGCGRILATAANANVKGVRTGVAFLYDLDGNLIKQIDPPTRFDRQFFGRTGSTIGDGRILINETDAKVNQYDLDGNFITSHTYEEQTRGKYTVIGNGKIAVTESEATDELTIYNSPNNLMHYLEFQDLL